MQFPVVVLDLAVRDLQRPASVSAFQQKKSDALRIANDAALLRPEVADCEYGCDEDEDQRNEPDGKIDVDFHESEVALFARCGQSEARHPVVTTT